jgi:undecaprenyl-diphosphatase
VVGAGAAEHLRRVELTPVPILHAIVLGLVQGLAEFLPISSSGHLILVPWLFGWNDFDSASTSKAFDVALHIGTLVAVIGYFRRDLVVYVREGLRLVIRREKPVNEEGRLAWLLVLSALPAAAVGAVFEETIDEHLGTPTLIAVSLIVFGLILAWADHRVGRRTIDQYRKPDAIGVGVAQALALNPGTSRSGITITAARTFGFSRDAAARISFLMSIPVTAGAIVFKLTKLVADGGYEGLIPPMIVGIITSGLSGWLAVWGTIKLVRTRSFTPFVIYRCLLGVVVLVVVIAGWR